MPPLLFFCRNNSIEGRRDLERIVIPALQGVSVFRLITSGRFLRRKITVVSISICLALMLVASAAFGAARSMPIVINHLCTELAAIPHNAIQTAQSVCKWHYARLSHGRQIMVGFEDIEAADPFYAAIWPKSGCALVRTLINGTRSGGAQRVQWNGLNDSGAPAASGIYLYRISADKKTSTRKILLLA